MLAWKTVRERSAQNGLAGQDVQFTSAWVSVSTLLLIVPRSHSSCVQRGLSRQPPIRAVLLIGAERLRLIVRG